MGNGKSEKLKIINIPVLFPKTTFLGNFNL